MKKFDVFIIGTGVAGTAIAHQCASAELKTGITDQRPYGGTCALRGCIPKKVLIGTSEVFDQATHLQAKGLKGIPKINWPELMAYKQLFVQDVPSEKEKGFKENSIATFHDRAKFISRNRLKVGVDTIEAEKIVIATGARPRTLDIAGKEHALTSDNFLDLKELPKSMVFAGGGYVAFEFAQLAARCGSKVTVVHMGASPLENFEPDMVKHAADASRDLGIEIVLNTEVTGIYKKKDIFIVVGLQNGESVEYPTEAVINSTGRVPNIEALDLKIGVVDYTDKGIEVNKHLQSVSNHAIYAAGDSSGKGLPLTPVASAEAKVIAANIINGNNTVADYSATPTVVFTVPPLASVGLTEKAAGERKLDINVNYQSVPNWFNAKWLNEKHYAFKVLTEKSSGKLLGAHLIGPNAEETINLFAMAIQLGLTAADIKKMTFSYPSLVSDIKHMI